MRLMYGVRQVADCLAPLFQLGLMATSHPGKYNSACEVTQSAGPSLLLRLFSGSGEWGLLSG